jgi:acetylornithine aminotransferase/acetylornithine/N-succinyldiaminopimelate aminotransferase
MLALELESADLAKYVVAETTKRRILINRTDDTVLRFLPPYILQKQHVDEAITALDTILSEQPAVAAAAPSQGGQKIGQ